MIALRWIATALLGGVWLLLAVGHVMSVIGVLLTKRSTSLIPLVGGVAGALSLIVCPYPGTARWAWVPALLDLGCIPMVASTLAKVLFHLGE
jgi:hypothetical protein